MIIFKNILVALTLLGSVNAAAISEIRPEIRHFSELASRAEQSCHVTDNWLWASYNIWIGVPYGGASDCDATKSALNDVTVVTLYKCRKDENGYIRLNFNSNTNRGQEINQALSIRYPSVNKFNCPKYDD